MSTPELRKAAIILMSLPSDEAAGILGQLDPKQVEAVTVEIARLGSISGDEQEQAIVDFANVNPSALGESGGMERARELVEKALGKNASGTLDNVRQQIEALPFGFLQKVDATNLLTFIIDEHPQTIALILCHLPPSHASEILSGLPSDRQLSVVRRVATMGQTSPEIISEVERGLENRMSSMMNQQYEKAGGVESVAGMLNVIDRSTERNLLENLAQEDPDLVEEIRRRMFIFEDITKLSDKDIQAILKEVETSQWSMALKSSSDELKEMILGNLSTRAADLLREEMEYLGPVKLSEVEKAQQQIVDVARKLEDMGEISLHSEGEAEQMIT